MIEIALASAVIAVLSQLSIPFPSGVPMTLQTFAICLCGYILKTKKGLIALVVYLLLGIIGLPVFASLKSGIGVLFGYTGGFLFGFIFLVLFSGIGVQIARKKSLLIRILCSFLFSLLGLVLCHFCGVIGYALVANVSFSASFLAVSVPYLLKDIFSIVLAILFAEVMNALLSKRKQNASSNQ